MNTVLISAGQQLLLSFCRTALPDCRHAPAAVAATASNVNGTAAPNSAGREGGAAAAGGGHRAVFGHGASGWWLSGCGLQHRRQLRLRRRQRPPWRRQQRPQRCRWRRQRWRRGQQLRLHQRFINRHRPQHRAHLERRPAASCRMKQRSGSTKRPRMRSMWTTRTAPSRSVRTNSTEQK